jgi:hypothetical protein
MARAMDIMQVNPFVRKAIIFMTGLRLKQSAGDFELQVLTIVPGFKVHSPPLSLFTAFNTRSGLGKICVCVCGAGCGCASVCVRVCEGVRVSVGGYVDTCICFPLCFCRPWVLSSLSAARVLSKGVSQSIDGPSGYDRDFWKPKGVPPTAWGFLAWVQEGKPRRAPQN